MAKKRIRIGVIGSGFMGRTHADAARRLDSTELVAVAGGRRADKLAADYGVDFEEEVASLIARADVDAIVITTPHHLHCDQALAAAVAGKHLLVEKPLATSVEDCDRMIAACRERDLILSVGYHQRFRESVRRTRDLIQAGEIGQVRCIQMSALFDIETMRRDSGFGGDWGWWKDPRSVAHLVNSGPHNIDVCRWWMETEVATVAAQSGTFREDNPNENTTMALLTFENGAFSTFWSSSVCPSPGFAGESFRFRIMGDDGVIDLDPYDKLQFGRDGQMQTIYQQPPVKFDEADSSFQLGRMQAYCDQMQAFVDSIHGQPGGEGTAKDGRAGVATVLAMLQAAADGNVVQLHHG